MRDTKYGVKQFVACVKGAHGKFMVYETGDPKFYLFCPMAPDDTQSTLQFPVKKTDLRPEIRSMLADGCGNYTIGDDAAAARLVQPDVSR